MLTLLIFIAVLGVTALLFGGWVTVTILRFVFRTVVGATSPLRSEPARPATTCANRGCGLNNPANARFCRRCGGPLGALRAQLDVDAEPPPLPANHVRPRWTARDRVRQV